MHRFKPVQVKGQSGKQRPRQSRHLRRYLEALDMPEMQQTEHCKQKQQQRCNAREADAIKTLPAASVPASQTAASMSA
jgi:hypothetical protein